jgi:ABC-type Zn uptake system ZnuABC Zn-binding protein ZnuA
LQKRIGVIRHILIFVVLVFPLAACGGQPGSDSGSVAPVVLTSTTFLADITRNIAGERVQVESLLPIGMDPHSYQATPQDIAKLSESKLVIINGAQYEQFLTPWLESTNRKTTLIEASTGLDPKRDANAVDPHMWLDPNLVVTYVENIREALTHLDPAGEAFYISNADAYIAELKKLDAWIMEQVNQIPPEKRLLVTNHEAFGYFAERYGFTIVGTVIESFSSDASPSAQQLAADRPDPIQPRTCHLFGCIG